MSTPYEPGQRVMFYPRVGKPGHEVEILDCRTSFYGWIITFRYADGRIQERSIGKFHTTPAEAKGGPDAS